MDLERADAGAMHQAFCFGRFAKLRFRIALRSLGDCRGDRSNTSSCCNILNPQPETLNPKP